MKTLSRKVLLSLLSVLIVTLIVSTTTTQVMAADWGTLKVGDEMTWKDYTNNRTIKIKILEIGDRLTVEKSYNGGEPFEITIGSGFYLLLPKSVLSGATQNYEWQGVDYKTYYDKIEYSDGSSSESWYDFNTGILFDSRDTSSDGVVSISDELLSSTADMAEASGGGTGGGGCLGTLFIALVSITTVVSYGLVRYRKKTV